MPEEDDPPYDITAKELMASMELRGEEALQEYERLGKARGVAEKLKTNTEKGISGKEEELEKRKAAFGANFIPPKEPKTFLELCLATLSDFTLQILIACAGISMFLAFFNMITADCDNTEEKQCRPVPEDHAAGGDDGSHKNSFGYANFFGLKISHSAISNLSKYINLSRNLFYSQASARSGGNMCDPDAKFLEKWIDFIDGGMIILTILIVILVTAYQDYTKEKQFRGLQDRLCNEQKATVIRNGEGIEIVVAELVVGDIANVKYGDLLPADGILVDSSELKVDESSLTGESDHVKKGIDCDPFLLGGTHVMEGSGKMIVTAVGPCSQSGIIMTLLGASADAEENNAASKQQQTSQDVENQATNDEPTDTSEQEKVISGGEGSILQQKLDNLTELIGMIGAFACFTTIGILFIRLIFELIVSDVYDTELAKDPEAPGIYLPQANLSSANQIQHDQIWPFKYCWLFYITEILGFLIIGVTVLVVAIPEGLPLAVTITLGYSMGKMMKDNNLVRHLDSCETMGNATAICSDKTGTLTTNRMTVVQSFMGEKFYKDCKPNPGALSKKITGVLFQGIAVNTSYTSQVVPDENGGQDQQLGNKTECALLGFSNELAAHGGPDFHNMKYEKLRQATPDSKFLKVYTFNSARKSMTTIIANPDDDGKTLRVFSKGASEIICSRCTSILNENGSPVSIEKQRDNLKTQVIEKMASEALRTIGLAYKDIPANSDLEDENTILSNLTLIAIVGIEDPVRPEVPDAIQQCQQAGITVRMVTGDNVMTARSIATKCGIIADPNDPNALVIDGKEFNNMIKDSDGKIMQDKIDEIWPKLRVLARSSPTDKYTLVKGMIESNIASEGLQVVAVTGDGTNDGPALKKADVGFAMGIAGTDVAKEASDIILMDDNFSSIVKAVMWGRNVYDSISKFLQFQLTVNVTAILCAVVGAAILGASPLSAVQMLWVNLIMDSFAALALATEIPTPELLTRKPYPRNKSLISQIMFKNIMFHAIYQFLIVILALAYPNCLLPCNDDIKQSDLDAGRPSQCVNGNSTHGTIWGVMGSKEYESLTGVSAKRFPTEQFTLIFNLFVCMQLFNQLNARKIHGEFNIFKGIANNSMFLVILLIEFLGQVFIVEVAQVLFGCASLSVKQWLFCLGVGCTELVVGQIITALPVGWVDPFIALFVRSNQPRHVSNSNVDINAESQVNFSESYSSRLGSATSGRRNSRYLWYRGYNRVTEQIELAKRYSIAPGELSLHDLCSLRDSNVSLTMTNVKEKRKIMSRGGKRLQSN